MSMPPRISKARLAAMVEKATVDCHDESEQAMGWFTMLDEHLAVPFERSSATNQTCIRWYPRAI